MQLKFELSLRESSQDSMRTEEGFVVDQGILTGEHPLEFPSALLAGQICSSLSLNLFVSVSVIFFVDMKCDYLTKHHHKHQQQQNNNNKNQPPNLLFLFSSCGDISPWIFLLLLT